MKKLTIVAFMLAITFQVFCESQDLSVQRETFYIPSGQPGKKLFARYWYPKDKANIRGLVFICHGFAEHLEYYDEFAAKLASLNIVAFGHDHLGHGLSDGKRATISSMDVYVNDVFVHASKAKQLYPNVPIFILGHSMGGLVTIRAILKNPNFFSGTVLEGPLIIPTEKPSAVMSQISKLAKLVAPDYIYLPLDLNDVSHYQPSVQRMKNDPLRYHEGLKISMAVAMGDAMKGLVERMSEITLPFLIIHSEVDKICAVEGSRLMEKRAKSHDKQLVTFPNAGHNLFLERPEVRIEALTLSTSWISQRCPTY